MVCFRRHHLVDREMVLLVSDVHWFESVFHVPSSALTMLAAILQNSGSGIYPMEFLSENCVKFFMETMGFHVKYSMELSRHVWKTYENSMKTL